MASTSESRKNRVHWLVDKCDALETERDELSERVEEQDRTIRQLRREGTISGETVVKALNAANEAVKIAAVVRQIVNRPDLDRRDVQSKLLVALQAFDASGVEKP